jgi:hypothetical protein
VFDGYVFYNSDIHNRTINIKMMIIIITNMYEYLKVGSADVLKENAGFFLRVPFRLSKRSI